MILALELYDMNNSAFTMLTKESILEIMKFYLFEHRIGPKGAQNIKEMMLPEKTNVSRTMRPKDK